MLRISKKGDEMILRDISINEIVSNGLILSSAFFLLYFGIIDTDRSLFTFIAILIVIVVTVYNLGFIQTKTVKIDRQKRILTINNRSLVKNISYVYRFGEISGLIYVETLRDKDGNKSHKLVFPLETGERLELSRSVSTGVERYFEAADVTNHLIFNDPKKIPQNFTGFNKF